MEQARASGYGERRDRGFPRLPRGPFAALIATALLILSPTARAAMIEAETASLPADIAAGLADPADGGGLHPYSACSAAGGAFGRAHV